MQHLSYDYSCARGLFATASCNTALSKFKTNMHILWSSTKDSRSRTKKTFTNALDRLGQLFSKDQTADFKIRESELLKSMYGTTKLTPGKLIDVNYQESNGSSSTFGTIGQ